MSLQLTQYVWGISIKFGPKMVLLALADFANNQGDCYASAKRLAHKCSMSRSTICLHLNYLRQQKLIHSTPQFRQDGKRACNQFKLLFAANPSPESARQTPESRHKYIRKSDGNYINSKRNSDYNLSYPKTGLGDSLIDPWEDAI